MTCFNFDPIRWTLKAVISIIPDLEAAKQRHISSNVFPKKKTQSRIAAA
jgi:hypothetical protein